MHPASFLKACIVGLIYSVSLIAHAQVSADPPSDSARLYAVEIKIGPAWDVSKKPHEQKYFAEHSANLKRLRDRGELILGARYSDKGLVVLRALSEQDAHVMMQQDPSIQNKVFIYEINEFNVFYSGTVQTRAVRKSSGGAAGAR